MHDLHDLAMKKDPDAVTVEDVLHNMRATLGKLKTGKHKAGTCATANVETAWKALNRELKAIADAARVTDEDDVAAQATADITAAAELQAKEEAKAGVAAPGTVGSQ
jgi:hypothetical protein